MLKILYCLASSLRAFFVQQSRKALLDCHALTKNVKARNDGYFRIVAFSILALCLSGCGFKLRGTQSLPPQLQTMYYQTDNPYGEFETLFKRLLASSKINLLPDPSKLAPTIHVSAEDSPPTTTSSVSSSSARVYTLTYKSTISVNDASGKVIVPSQTISAVRTLSLQHDEMIEIAPQVAIVKREMMQELIVNIFNVLCAKDTFKALNKTL